jgi:hypothetical protein
MGTTYTMSRLDSFAAHGPGGALLTVDDTVHVIAYRSAFDPGPPIPSHDTTGWSGSVSETLGPPTAGSQIAMYTSNAAFDTDLCPPPMTGLPDPTIPPPPVFLARVTGSGEHGAYSTELYVNYCNTLPPS